MTDTKLTSLLKGTVDLLILRCLQQGPSHGYEVSKWVRERTDGVLTLEDTGLYQALHRLEDNRWITSTWAFRKTTGGPSTCVDHSRPPPPP